MARPQLCVLLILAIPAVAGATVTDPTGDVLGATLAEAGDQPAVDILLVTGEASGGRIDLSIEVNGTLPIGDQATQANASHRFSYLFLVALGAAPGTNVYRHIDAGGDALGATCHFHQGRLDLTCRVTQGDTTLAGQGASGRHVRVGLHHGTDAAFEVAAIGHESLGDPAEERNRTIIAQDFTGNALPYDAGAPGPGNDGVEVPPGPAPWYQRTWVLVAGALAVVAGAVWWRLRKD